MINEVLKKITLKAEDKIAKVIDKFKQSEIRILFIVDKNGRLRGAITNREIRRAMIDNVSFDEPCYLICDRFPISIQEGYKEGNIQELYESNNMTALPDYVPVVDNDNRIVDLLDNINKKNPVKKNPVIIMAGGLGSRLAPLTLDCPKPLLKISGESILEIIIGQLKEEGFSDVFISVNYLADMVVEAIGNGERWGLKIEYIREEKRLGTAGPLGLIADRFDSPFIVINSDILTKINFSRLIKYHYLSSGDATLCVRRYTHTVPYGVVEISDHKITNIQEKPGHDCFISAGIYVFSPSVLQYVPKDQYYDMNQFLDKMLQESKTINPYLIHEYWLDIGRVEDLERAHKEYQNIFNADLC